MFETEEEWLWKNPEGDGQRPGKLLPARRLVPPGDCRHVDVLWGRLISLSQDGWLPASLGGHVAVHIRLAGPIGATGAQRTQ